MSSSSRRSSSRGDDAAEPHRAARDGDAPLGRGRPRQRRDTCKIHALRARAASGLVVRRGDGRALVEERAAAPHQRRRVRAGTRRPRRRDATTRGRARSFPQIIHFLKISRSGWRQTVDMLSHEDLDAIVDAYGRAAVRARACGFDGVELHMAHAYTLSSFLSRLNARRDEYGGSPREPPAPPAARDRARARAPWATTSPWACASSATSASATATPCSTRGRSRCAWREPALDYISLSAGGKFEDARPIEGEPLYPVHGLLGRSLHAGRRVSRRREPLHPRGGARARFASAGLATPVVAAGKIGTRELAEQVLERGQGDLVGMARALLADPDIPRKWRAGRDETGRALRLRQRLQGARRELQARRLHALAEEARRGRPRATTPLPPEWPATGAALTADVSGGRVLLRWRAATDNEGVYGYELLRAESGGRLVALCKHSRGVAALRGRARRGRRHVPLRDSPVRSRRQPRPAHAVDRRARPGRLCTVQRQDGCERVRGNSIIGIERSPKSWSVFLSCCGEQSVRVASSQRRAVVRRVWARRLLRPLACSIRDAYSKRFGARSDSDGSLSGPVATQRHRSAWLTENAYVRSICATISLAARLRSSIPCST